MLDVLAASSHSSYSTRYFNPQNLSLGVSNSALSPYLQYPAFDPVISPCSDSLDILESAIAVSLHQSNLVKYTPDVSQPFDQNKHSAESLSNLTGKLWETTHTDFSSLEPLPPEDNQFSAIQSFQTTPLDNFPFRSYSTEDSTRSSYNASTISSKSEISSETLALPISPRPSSDCGLESNEKLTTADRFGTFDNGRPEPPPRRRKPRSPSSKDTESLPCPNFGCPKTFVRRGELKLV